MTTVSHLGNSPGAQCGYRPRDKAGQNAKLSPNVPPWRSADCRDRTGQKPKALSRMSRCAIAPFGPKRALPTLTLFWHQSGLADWIDLGTHSILALIGTDVRLHHWSRNLPLARYDAK
jgi:hypothetical protein